MKRLTHVIWPTKTILAIVIAFVLVAAAILPVAAQERRGISKSDGWENAPVWIVRLEPGSSLESIISTWFAGFNNPILQRYSQVMNGFAARMPEEFAQRLSSDSRVLGVMPDFEVHTWAQTIPTGVQRINATSNPTASIDGIDQRVNVDVAVLDTGVSPHPDLNVVGGVDCTGSRSWADGNGHGTHVAGTIGAIDNGSGVVGVAPGARIWSVRVLDSSGSGYGSWILCGIDWVTANAGTIEVANMSLGGTTSYRDDNNCGRTNRDVLHQAICESVDAGVTYVVAAGNDASDAAGYFPASFNEVITVSALVDTDGKAGGLGPSTSAGADDRFASFSNYGADVDVIAPGVGILSTSRTGGYATMSGTSMATPHVAGAAALLKASNPSATPAQIRSMLIASGDTQSWSGDRDNWKEPLVNLGTSGNNPTPTPIPTPTPSPSPTPEPTIDAQVVSVSAPASVNAGSSVTVDVSVRNNGSASASIPVTLSETPGGFTQTKSISLGGGASGTVTFSWSTTTSTTPGAHTLTATTSLSGDSNSSNNSASRSINVVAPAQTSTMSVSSLTLTAARSGRNYRLTSQVQIKANGVNVSNATVVVELHYPNGSRSTMSSRTASNGTVTFRRTVTSGGTYTVTVTGVSKTGLTYDPSGNSVTSRSVTVR